jgi:UDP-2-acetamido-2,6-beta-L-arabino-hexul-4-ose reductase
MQAVLVTGAAGFLGRNLLESLRLRADLELHAYDVENDPNELDQSLAQAEVIFHLAGVNRPPTEAEYAAGNLEFTAEICRRLRAMGRAPKIVFTSSIQASLDNPYGRSKAAAEQALRDFACDAQAEVSIYRLPNVFGKWCRPNYNSVTATFCHQIIRGLPIHVSDPDRVLELVYIDDVVEAFCGELLSRSAGVACKEVAVTHRVPLGRLAEMIQTFQASRDTLSMPDLADALARKLYATFLSHLPETDLAYALEQRIDDRGTLAEFLKSAHFGQIFVSRTKPGVTRGNHYHHHRTRGCVRVHGPGSGLPRYRATPIPSAPGLKSCPAPGYASGRASRSMKGARTRPIIRLSRVMAALDQCGADHHPHRPELRLRTEPDLLRGPGTAQAGPLPGAQPGETAAETIGLIIARPMKCSAKSSPMPS